VIYPRDGNPPSKSGLEIVHAFNGVEAFSAALRERPDAIITDYIMPEGSGDYLLVKLQNSDLTPQYSGNRCFRDPSGF
jgi:DNA-binding response OmpR family regulator